METAVKGISILNSGLTPKCASFRTFQYFNMHLLKKKKMCLKINGFFFLNLRTVKLLRIFIELLRIYIMLLF